MRFSISHAFVALSLASAIGCGASNAEAPTTHAAPPPPAPSGPVHARGGGDVTAVVGEAGGDLTLSNGLTLEIPAGALSEPVEITMRVATDSAAFRNREDEQAIGQSVRITPDLTAATGKSFSLSVPFTSLPNGFAEADAALAIERPVHEREGVMDSLVSTRWDHIQATTAGGHMRAQTDRLEGFRIQFVVSR
ncbi:MAG: hypothetical protein IPK60_17800 [Sandaracinaceae bacterium]|nr:hypothetical protein [Sandaracinaceae bacterium]